MRELDLYPAVRSHLMQQGFAVDVEVNHCDLVAIKTEADPQEDEVVVVELKLSPNIKLLIQATDRQQLTTKVYVAVPEPARVNKHWRGIERVLKQLGLGLILVRQSPVGTSAQTTIMPTYSGKIDRKARAALLAEWSGRSRRSDWAQEQLHQSSASRIKPVTAYKEIAITIASILHHLGPQPVSFIKTICGEKTQGILANNHYGWFARIKRGTYGLTETGQVSLREYPELQARGLSVLAESE